MKLFILLGLLVAGLASAECRDDYRSDMVVCDGNKIMIVAPNINEETHLPGCAGLLTNPALCRGNGSMINEAYAIRFKFKTVIDAVKNSHFLIQTITVDDMRLDDIKFRKFDMTVSTIPGDFDGKGQGWQIACSKKWAVDGTELTIRAIQHYQNDVIGYDECPLTPNTAYYINVRAALSGCSDGSEYPSACRVSVNTKIPPTN